MSGKKPITERRLDAIYDFKNYANSENKKKLLEFLLATASHKQAKEAVEELNIKVKDN